MNRRLSILVLSLALALGVRAQSNGEKAIRTSTDPATAAAVLRAADKMQARAIFAPQTPTLPVRGSTEAGVTFLSGGVTADDRTSMYVERGRYNLWVTTVAKPSGAYLTDARLRVVDVNTNKAVLERTMDGPWLFARLPAGKYDVSALWREEGAANDQKLATRVLIARVGQRQVVLRFESAAQVGAEHADAFKGNPFATPPAAAQ
jgi:hypothetical protein